MILEVLASEIVSIYETPQMEYVTELDGVLGIDEILSGLSVSVNHADGSRDIIEWNSYEWEEEGFDYIFEIDFTKPGTYPCEIINQKYNYSETIYFKIMTMEEAKEKYPKFLIGQEEVLVCDENEYSRRYVVKSYETGEYLCKLSSLSCDMRVYVYDETGKIIQDVFLYQDEATGYNDFQVSFEKNAYYFFEIQSLGNKRAELSVCLVRISEITDWNIYSQPQKIKYYPYEFERTKYSVPIFMEGCLIELHYADGTNKTIGYGSLLWYNNGFSISTEAIKKNVPGRYPVTIEREGKKKQFFIQVEKMSDCPKEEITAGDKKEITLSAENDIKVYMFTPRHTQSYTVSYKKGIFGSLELWDSDGNKLQGEDSMEGNYEEADNETLTRVLNAGQTYYYVFVPGEKGETILTVSGTHEHEYMSQVIQESSCLARKKIRYTCRFKDCGYYYDTLEGVPLGHNYMTKEKKPGCTEDGYKYQVCQRCNQSTKKEVLSATGHQWSSYQLTKNATKNSDGVEERACIHCGLKEEKKIKYQEITAKNQTVVYKSKSFYLKAKAKGLLNYKSSNTKVAKISANGRVTVGNYGEAVITLSANRIGDYQAAQKRITIKVVPKKSSMKKLSSGKRKMTVLWKPDKTVTGYQIYLSTNKQFKKRVIVRNYKKKVNGKATLTGIPGKKMYYVKIRSYKSVCGKKYYGAWSNVKKIKV